MFALMARRTDLQTCHFWKFDFLAPFWGLLFQLEVHHRQWLRQKGRLGERHFPKKARIFPKKHKEDPYV
jgi:hypothetical protein